MKRNKKHSPAVTFQLVPSAVESSVLVEKVISLSNLTEKQIERNGSKIKILSPGDTEILSEADWINLQQIGEKTIYCIEHIW